MSTDPLGRWLSKFTASRPDSEKKSPLSLESSVNSQSVSPASSEAFKPKSNRISPRPSQSSPKAPSPRRFSDHDPHKDRKTHEKREKFHPTNAFMGKNVGDIRVVPLGGMQEVGENMMFLEWGDDIIVIDTGLVFPDLPDYGVDLRLPDTTYLEKNAHKIRGVIYTHGHLDHIGGAPYILPKLKFPKVYATRLTRDMVIAQCEEHPGVKEKVNVTEVTPRSHVKMGKFEVEFFHINHSIPDGVGVAVKTPYGFIVNTSDFKIDHNPADEQPADLERIAHLGHQGVILAMVDSTNALRSGHAISETIIKNNLHKILNDAEGRVIVATFSSNVGRVARLVESAEALGRTVFLTGRSMERNIAIARKNNFLKCKDKTLQRISSQVEKMDPKKVLILSTGSQGEELAALTRMARGEHADVKLRKEDTIVFSSTPIPGNEGAVGKILDNLASLGIDHIDNKQMEVHVSGHGHAEELKLMTALLNPKYFAPIHGELHMRYAHQKLAINELGYNPDHCFIMKNGQGVILGQKGARAMTEKERITNDWGSLVQEKRPLALESFEARKLLYKSGALVIQIQTGGSTIKAIEFRPLGFLMTDLKHPFYTDLETGIKNFWTKSYDPSRPVKVLEKPLKAFVDKYLLQTLNLAKDPLVEILIVG